MNYVERFAAVAGFFLATLLGLECFGEPAPPRPAWVHDPATSKWIDLAEEAESHGLFQRLASSEGLTRPTRRDTRACWEIVAPGPKGGPRYWYFQVGPWADWAAWIGEDDVEVTFVYFDGRPGKIPFAYDSSDATVRSVSGRPGAWRHAEALPDGLILQGSGQWKIKTVPLPMAIFHKRCNGDDFRLGPIPADSDFAMAGVAVARVPHRAAAESSMDSAGHGANSVAAARPNSPMVLANTQALLAFNARGLALVEHRQTRHRCTRAGAQAPLFVLGVKKPGLAPLQEISSAMGSLCTHAVKNDGGNERLDMSYRLANGMTVLARIVLEPSGLSRWTMEIDNRSDVEVAEVEYPILPGVRLGSDARDDTLFLPQCWGQVWPNPVVKSISNYWGPHMRWMDLWDKTDGLYVGTHDAQLNDTCFSATPDSAVSLQMSVRQRICVPPRGHWKSGQHVVALHGGDWHEGADIYKAYVAKALKASDPAEWVRWADIWETQSSDVLPYQGWGVLLQDADRLAAEGVDFLAANRQMTDGLDGGYCGLYLYPCTGWGSVREFQQQLAALTRRGIHYTPYLNWHLWAPGYGHYPRCGITPWKSLPADAPRRDDAWWAKVAAQNYDGTFPAAGSDRYAQQGADIGVPEWRERLAYWTRRYLAWGCDGMYYDQFNVNYFSGRLPGDYPTHGFWTRASLDTLRKIKDESRRVNPYYVSSGEVYMDALGQVLDLHMTSGVVNRLEFYAYCNPGQLFIDGGWNGGLRTEFGGPERERFIWQIGGRFEQLYGPEPWRSQILALRRRVKSVLYRSIFRDTVGLRIQNAAGQEILPEPAASLPNGPQHAPYRGISGRWFLFAEGQQRAAIVNVINTPLDDAATVRLRTREFGPVRSAWAFTLEGGLIPIQGAQEGDEYRFRLPKAEMASIVLVNRLGPLVRWTADRTVAQGETARLRLWLTNLGPQPLDASITLRPPQDWPLSTTSMGPLAPGATQEASLPVRVPRHVSLGRYDLHAEVVTADSEFTAYRMISVAEPVVAEFRGNPGSYHLLIENLTSAATKGDITVSAADTALVVRAADSVELPAHTEVRVPVTVAGQDRLTRISEMNAVVRTPSAKWDLVRAVMPTVPNGDFEMDTAGDGKPDGWMGRGKRDRCDLDHIHLDSGGPSGSRCLCVEASGDPAGFVRAYSVHGAVRPGTKYRVSGWMKRADRRGDVYIRFSGLGQQQLRTTVTGRWTFLKAVAESDPKSGAIVVSCFNTSRGPAWFDQIKVEETRSTGK